MATNRKKDRMAARRVLRLRALLRRSLSIWGPRSNGRYMQHVPLSVRCSSNPNMDEEVTDQVRVQIGDGEVRRRAAGRRAGEAQEQAEGVAIAGDRVRARVHLGAESIGEELLDKGRKGHGRHR